MFKIRTFVNQEKMRKKILIAIACLSLMTLPATAQDLAISADFYNGNIQVLKQEDCQNIELEVKSDNLSEFKQWFYFRLKGAKNTDCLLKIMNAGKTSYVRGWENYQAFASYDRKNWFRVNTVFSDNILRISHQPTEDVIYFAYFVPYSPKRQQYWQKKAEESGVAKVISLGKTPQKQDIKLFAFGDEAAKDRKKIWMISGQHPGETMGYWFSERVIEILSDPKSDLAKSLLAKAVFYIVPQMNEDGSVNGNHRTNIRGRNLNREWLNPSLEDSPEVYHVKEKLLNTGVDLFLDVHGDETLPYNFVVRNEGIPSYNEKLKEKEDLFVKLLMSEDRAFQDEFGYGKDLPGKANLTLASKFVAEKFGCLALTIEMPYKDNPILPDKIHGWDDRQSRKLGESTLKVINSLIQTGKL